MQWRWPITLTAFLILVVVTPLNAQAPAGIPSEAATPIEALHQVQSNDNLHLLAAYYYGDARQWVQILNTNRDGIRNPSVIHPGQILRISLSPNWNPGEPYKEWRRRVHDLTPAGKLTLQVPAERPAAPKETSPGEGAPSAAPEEPAAPPKEEG
ncbi:MAG: LysM peptidoglycan-binding domain-containing protein [candidate division NC10 bacterium]|nr:LysM peptidoglycan-binding domain-containing protein [candidate division NC10 bacterium]